MYHIEMSRHIGLIDCNNFFVSCERLFRPDLRARPVVVLSSNDGCVVARSQEIKDKGIPMGVPYFQIKDTLKEMGAEIFSSHFALYRDVSARVFNVVREHYPEIEQYSIDECFFTFECADPVVAMEELKRVVEQAVGIPVSIGVGPSKTIAKLASKQAKTAGGVFYATPEFCAGEMQSVKLGTLWGVGRQRAVAFSAFGLERVGDLLALSPRLLDTRFGVEGVRLQKELSGGSYYAVTPRRLLQQSFMSTRSFGKDITKPEIVLDALLYHASVCAEDLVSSQALASEVRVIIAPSRMGSYSHYASSLSANLTLPTNDIFLIQKAVTDLFYKCFKENIPYKRAGVVVGRISALGSQTASLFNDAKSEKTKLISNTLSVITKKHGSEVLRLGRTKKYEAIWKSKSATLSPAYTTSWRDLKRVKA